MANLASPQNPISPNSDKRFWNTLHKRVESILETRKTDPSCSISSTVILIIVVEILFFSLSDFLIFHSINDCLLIME